MNKPAVISDGSADPISDHALWPGDFGFTIADATRLLRRTFNLRVQKFGVTGAQWRVIAYLMRREGVTQVEIAEELDDDKAAIGRTIERLERLGLVQRENCAEDGRAKRVFLTPAAMEMGLAIKDVAEATYAEILESLPPAERPQLMAMLTTISARLSTMYDSEKDQAARARPRDR